MKLFRKMLFWLHLIIGCVAGLVIAVLCFTGFVLVFQGRVDHALMPSVVKPAGAGEPLSLEQVKAKLLTNGVGMPFEFVLHKGANEPLQARWGHTRSVYLNPWTADPIPDQALATRVHAFFFWNEEMHTTFGAGMRSVKGAAITRAGTLIMFILTLSGLYLWWPRSLKPAALKSILLFKGGLKGKARDWNWHNVIGFWTLVPMTIFLFTALVWSYTWVARPFYKVMGAPVRRAPATGDGHAAPAAPPAGAVAAAAVSGAAPVGAGPAGPGRGPGGAGPGRGPGGAGPGGAGPVAAAQPIPLPPVYKNLDELAAIAKSQAPNWVSFEFGIPRSYYEPLETMGYDPQKWYQGGPHGMTQVMIDPITGQVVSTTPFEARDMALRLHALLRSWHTGDEWGLAGQIVAAVSCLGALVLIWTGYALTWRRYVNYRNNKKRRLLAAAKAQKVVHEMSAV